MTDQERAPGASPEPQWPTWTERDEGWSLVEYGQGVCACHLLDVKMEDWTLFGAQAWSVARCVDCQAVWERLSQTHPPASF